MSCDTALVAGTGFEPATSGYELVALRCVVIGMFLSCSSAIVGSLGRYMLSAPLFGVMGCFVHRSVHNTGKGHPSLRSPAHRQPRRSRFGLAGSDRHRADDRGRPPYCPGRLHQVRR